MEITEVRIFPTESKDGKLKAFATMTFDDWFVVRNVKIIQGNNGLFVAMPSRKAMDSCQKCRFKNVIGSRYCNQCGAQIEHQPSSGGNEYETRGNHMDIAHPITQECREYIQQQILNSYDSQSGQRVSEDKGQRAPEDKEQKAQSDAGVPVIAEVFDLPADQKNESEQSQNTETANIEDLTDKDIEL